MDENKFIKTPNGDFFAKESECKGVLPLLLQDLLTARKKVKAALLETKDPLEIRILDARQYAIKLCANSVYGFAGA